MEPKKSTFDISRLLLDTVNTYEETADAIVPDTFPDLMRIAAVFGTPQLKDDVLCSGGRRLAKAGHPSQLCAHPRSAGHQRALSIVCLLSGCVR